jgi:hypothetical protein
MSVRTLDVHASPKNPLAGLTIGFWAEKPSQESLVQLTNPIAQRLMFYVSDVEKARFIAELRAALTAWESSP